MTDDRRLIRWELIVSATGERTGKPLASGYVFGSEATLERAKDLFAEHWEADLKGGAILFMEQNGTEILRYDALAYNRDRKSLT